MGSASMTARKGLCPAVVAVDGLGAEWDKRRSAERVAINDLTNHTTLTNLPVTFAGTGNTYGILPKGARATQTSSLFKL
jgi:hypothetical protein